MRLRNCPVCYGMGRSWSRNCWYCHGQKVVYSEFVKWNKQREKYLSKKKIDIDKELNKLREEKLEGLMKKWEKKNPKPRKFKAK